MKVFIFTISLNAMAIVILLSIIFMFHYPVKGQTLTYAKKLHTDLFNGYKKGVTPLLNQSQPLQVGVVFFLSSFLSFKEVEETLSFTGGISLNWTDPSLVWNSSSYGNINTTIIDPEDIWIPPIFLVNSVDTLEPIGNDAKFYTTLVSDGQVFYTPGGIMRAKCRTNISKFPFDTQACSLMIAPWGTPITNVQLSSMYSEARLDWFTPHSDWTLLEYYTSVSALNGYSVYYVNLKIKRQPLYYAVMIILPTLLFALLNPLVFILPVESGERVSLAMTILLSYAIFLTLVSASIPPTSNPMCVLLITMIVIIAISGVIVTGAIISSKYYYLEKVEKLGKFLRYVVDKTKRTGNEVEPFKDKAEAGVAGKDMSMAIDNLFFYGTYLSIFVTVVGFFLFVTI